MKSPASGDSNSARSGGPGEFPATRWSQVALVGGADVGRAQQALEQLCQSYWQPIYGFLRRKGFPPHEAEDLTQQSFFRLLQHNSVASADRSKGRFRSFLLGALTHFLTDEFRKSSAQKRGRALLPFAADFSDAEQRYLQEPDPSLTQTNRYFKARVQ